MIKHITTKIYVNTHLSIPQFLNINNRQIPNPQNFLIIIKQQTNITLDNILFFSDKF